MNFDDISNQLTDDDLCITYLERVSDRIPTLRQTYVQYTLPQGHGYPLFLPLVPYDSTNSELREHGLRVGDVGWFDQAGGFYFCFNVFDALDHPRNTSLPGTKVTPKDYTPFPTPASAIKTSCKAIEPMTILASKELRTSFFEEKITFTFPRTLGAATIYPSGGNSEDIENSFVFDEYLAANAESWYEQLLTQVKMRNGSLHILLGVDTCSDFGRMSLNEPQTTDQDVDFCTLTACGCSLRGKGYHWPFSGTTGMSLFSTGLCSESTYQLGSSIAVSLRTASVSLRDDIWTRLIVRQRHRLANRLRTAKAGGPYLVTDDVESINSEIDEAEDMRVKPWPELEHQDEQRGREGGGMYSVVQDHPALDLHDHLRQRMPGAKATIVHDSVWMNVLQQEDDFYPGSEVVLDRLQPLYDVVELNDVALFVKKEQRSRTPPTAQKTFDCAYPGCNEKFPSKPELQKHKKATLHKQRSSCIIC